MAEPRMGAYHPAAPVPGASLASPASPPRTPRISVVMPVHNEERHVRKAVDSILEQTFGDFECIVVDDGSTDATADILAALDDPRIRILRNAQCRGIQRALRQGMEAARGEYIARQDGDDLSAPGRFAAQVRHLEEHPDCVLVGTGCYLDVRDGSRPLGLRLHRLPIAAAAHGIAVRLIFGFNDVVHTSVMFRRRAIDAAGGYSARPEHLGCEDYELWRRLVERGARLDNLRSPLVVHRINPDRRRAAARIATRRPSQNVDGIAVGQLESLLGYPMPPQLMRILRDVYGIRRTLRPATADLMVLRRVLGDIERIARARFPGARRAIARTFFGLRLRLHLVQRLPAPILRLIRVQILGLRFVRSLLSRVCFRPRLR